MTYERGQEPEELQKYIRLLTKELNETFPEGLIISDLWKHERWDRVVEYLIDKLGYPDNVSFLKAYGFDVLGELNTKEQEMTRSQPVERPHKKALVCPKCGSDDVSVETFQENLGTTTVSSQKFKFKQRGHGIIWWLFIGWWWWLIDLMLWVCFFPFRLIIQLFKKKKYKGTATTVSQSVNEVIYKKMFTCHECGHSWTANAGQGSTMSAISKSKENVKKLKRNVR